MTRVSFSNIAVGVVLLVLGYQLAGEGETVVLRQTRVDTVPPAALVDSIERLALEADGLRAKLAGRVRVEPVHILRTDTLVTPPDTVLQLVRVEGQSLIVAPLIKGDSLWAPELHRFNVADCDDGWSWAAGEVVCDRARFGHLSATISAVGTYPLGATARAGIAWIPGYRSGWRASVETDPVGRLSLTVTRGWSFF